MRWKTRNRFRRRRSSTARPAALACLSAVVVTAFSSWNVAPAGAAGDEHPRPAVIDFVTLGGIRDWKAEGSDALRIQSRQGTWYRATFLGPCPGLQFSQSVAFVTDGTDRLDRFSSLLVDGQRCWFRSFEKIEASAPEAAPEPQ